MATIIAVFDGILQIQLRDRFPGFLQKECTPGSSYRLKHVSSLINIKSFDSPPEEHDASDDFVAVACQKRVPHGKLILNSVPPFCAHVLRPKACASKRMDWFCFMASAPLRKFHGSGKSQESNSPFQFMTPELANSRWRRKLAQIVGGIRLASEAKNISAQHSPPPFCAHVQRPLAGESPRTLAENAGGERRHRTWAQNEI